MQIDLCCGTKKRSGALGVDWAPGPVIDLVHNLDQTPWPMASNSAEDILCEHGIEHVQSVPKFLAECHRILKPNGLLTIVTPHYSCRNSYGDPTHLRHLSAFWFKPFLADGYFGSSGHDVWEVVSANVTFSSNFFSKLGFLMAKWRGLDKWERNFAFCFTAMDIKTTLKAVKKQENIH